MICSKRKQETIFYRDLLADQMADCIVQLHCMTGCDANSGFYGKGKKSVYDQVAKNPEARWQLSWCGKSLDLEEEVVKQLFEFTRHVIYGHNKSSTMAEATAAKWKRMKNKSFVCLPPDADSLRQYCLRANYLAYLMCHRPGSTTPRHSDMAGSWWVVAVALSATRDLHARRIYLHQGQLKRAGKMTARRRMRRMRRMRGMMYRGGGGFI